jgi:hypothetical protein
VVEEVIAALEKIAEVRPKDEPPSSLLAKC